ncbi:tetratricopeptide repeat protein [Thiothrix winogradskyi]|uniref:Tetratricopeptide repeat protein n=1 Tax=Thiothrix winogradskyi TaxID=96472 RepID=A0ABY3T4N1_9GAMM|nr:tetratricopeptide repeat protein [Thiothrix winogradskyi]UJS25680.1 hypothetical protein L2Y54_06465 [Thiothrix winogradskyi]
MHIFRWLMKHPILLAWLLAVIAILLNFSVGTKSVEHADKVATKLGQPAAEQSAHAAAPAVVAEQQPVQAAAPAVVAEQQPEKQPVQAAAPAVVAEQQPVQAAAPAVVAEQQPVQAAASAVVAEQQPVQAAAPAVVAEQQPVQAAAPAVVAEQQTQAVAPAVAGTPADLLRAAREAYWANELDRAAGLYNDLLKQAPDSLEYKGELANVYWKQGNAQQAATLFAEVAPKLAAQGRVTEALNMKLYVDMVNPELAKQIDAALKK